MSPGNLVYCNRCSAPFDPKSNRQRFCSKVCRLGRRTPDRRQWRRVLADFKRSPPEVEQHERGVWIYFRDLGETYGLVPDKGWNAEDDIENVSRMSAETKAEVWMLDSAELKARDRRRQGVPEFRVIKGLGQPDLYRYHRDPESGIIVLVPASETRPFALAA